MMNTMKFESWGTTYELQFKKGEYQADKTLANQIMGKAEDEDWYEPFASLTVCLCKELPKNHAFFDSNNCPRTIIQNLIDEGVATMTTISASSGHCTYPLIKFSEEWLESLEKI